MPFWQLSAWSQPQHIGEGAGLIAIFVPQIKQLAFRRFFGDFVFDFSQLKN